MYTVSEEESESEVESLEILHPDLEIKEKHLKSKHSHVLDVFLFRYRISLLYISPLFCVMR